MGIATQKPEGSSRSFARKLAKLWSADSLVEGLGLRDEYQNLTLICRLPQEDHGLRGPLQAF